MVIPVVGAALSIRSVVDKPIKICWERERNLMHWIISTLNVWPTVFSEWVILFSLVEKAQEQFDEEESRRLQQKLAKNQFSFTDFLKQIQQIKENG